MEKNSDQNSNHGKTTLRRNSKSHASSTSDAESTISQVDSFHSPLRSDLPENEYSFDNNCLSIVPVTYYSAATPSPGKPNSPAIFPATGENCPAMERPPVAVNRFVREEPTSEVKKVGLVSGGEEEEEEVGGERRSRAAVAAILKKSKRNAVVKKVALGCRVFEVVCCLVSFSVMAADRTQGWSGDSFDGYIEYRYCVAVNVIGFVYSGFQGFDIGYLLATGKHLVSHHLRYHLDFTMDQILAYLLMSASSSAATRVDDWISNWGGDEFTLMANASISMSFLAFIAFALSSLMSGYNLCNLDSS